MPVEKFDDHLLPDSEDDEFKMMIEEFEQELGDRVSDKAHLWPTESSVKSSDLALVEKGLSSSEIEELEDFRRQQLRGSLEGDVNHLAIIPRIVDFLQHRVDEAKALKNIILNGNVAEAAAALCPCILIIHRRWRRLRQLRMKERSMLLTFHWQQMMGRVNYMDANYKPSLVKKCPQMSF